MPVRGQRLVRKYRGVIRADLRGGLHYATIIFNRNTKKPFLTGPQADLVGQFSLLMQQLLTEKILV